MVRLQARFPFPPLPLFPAPIPPSLALPLVWVGFRLDLDLAILGWQAFRRTWQTPGKPGARIVNMLASIAVCIKVAFVFVHFRWQVASPSTRFYNTKLRQVHSFEAGVSFYSLSRILPGADGHSIDDADDRDDDTDSDYACLQES